MEPRYAGAAPEPKLMMLEFLESRRQAVLGKVGAMPYEAMTTSVLPSGWTPLGMLTHLVFMERRWLVWGFKAEAVREPQGDRGADHRFQVSKGWATWSSPRCTRRSRSERARSSKPRSCPTVPRSAAGSRRPRRLRPWAGS